MLHLSDAWLVFKREEVIKRMCEFSHERSVNQRRTRTHAHTTLLSEVRNCHGWNVRGHQTPSFTATQHVHANRLGAISHSKKKKKSLIGLGLSSIHPHTTSQVRCVWIYLRLHRGTLPMLRPTVVEQCVSQGLAGREETQEEESRINAESKKEVTGFFFLSLSQ